MQMQRLKTRQDTFNEEEWDGKTCVIRFQDLLKSYNNLDSLYCSKKKQWTQIEGPEIERLSRK